MTIAAPSRTTSPQGTCPALRAQVLVFSTSIGSKRQVAHVRAVLDGMLAPQGRWTVDLEDRDRVLRIERCALDAEAVITALARYGVMSAELE